MAYTLDGTSFDVVGLYQKNGTDYMMSVSNDGWQMYSNTVAEPNAGNTAAAKLDALKVSFSETDAYTLNFEADLAEGQKAFAFGCGTQLGNRTTSGDYYNTGALKAMVKDGALSQIAMVGAGSFETAADTDPAFVIKPLNTASRFWIGDKSDRTTYAYNTSGGDATETIDGQNVVTLLEGTDSGMTMSWMNVPSGGSVKFQFRVGSVANVNGGVDYATECLTGLTANTEYTITVDETSYNLTADESGEIPLSGTSGGQSYDLIGKKITIQKSGESASREITVDARPAAPSTPTALSLDAAGKPENVPHGVEVSGVSETSVTISPKAGQEYYYSTDGRNWTRIEDTQVAGLNGDSVQIKTRRPATKFDLASKFSSPVTVALRPMLTASASDYSGIYDGNPHSITVTASEGAVVQYSANFQANYENTNPSYTAAGTYRVFYRVTKDGCYPAYGYAVVTITKKPVTADLTVAEKTYDGTPAATVTAAVDSDDLISGDSISITGLTGIFDNANAGEGKTVTVNASGKSITGADNYTVTIPDSATGKIAPKPITVTANAKTKTYGEADPALTYQVSPALLSGDNLTGALARAAGTDVGTYAIGLGTLANGNYAITFVGADLTITQKESAPTVTMEPYAYGTTPSTPSISANGSGGTVTVYYSTYSDIVTNPDHRIVWNGMTGTTLRAGTYYMIAHVAGTVNCTEGTTDLITFKVNPSPYAKPTAPKVRDFTVTIDEADREKKLEYSLDGTNWVTVPTLNSSGSFELTGLAGNTSYTVYLRQKASADGNYAASDPVSADFTTPAQYSVAYNANYGSGTVPASVTQNSDSSVTVASGSGLRRTGYTFNGWNTKADGSGTPYAAGDTISAGATLYAQWAANTYTVKFNANGGTGTMADQGFTYVTDDAAGAQLSDNTFTKAGFHFAGWATSAGGAVVYSDQQSVKNLASGGSVTLYAVWVQNVYGISGRITSASNADVTVKLMCGNTQIGDSKTVSMTGSTTGTYDFSNIPAGTYNIVATQDVSGKTRTVTALVVVTDKNQTENVTVPSGDTNSVLDVKENTRPVVVGGLDDEASTKAEAGKSVTVTMTVEKQEEQQLPDTASQAEQQTQEAISEIKAEASGKTLEFMDIEVEKKVQESGQPDIPEKLAVTNTVMEIVIPYDMTGKSNITVYRNHNGSAAAFTQLSTRPVSGAVDGTYYLDTVNHLIYVYTQKFSTYAIGYNTQSGGGSGSGGSSSGNSSTISTPSAKNGTVSVSPKSASKGTTVTVTVTPDKGYVLETLTVTDASGKKLDLKNLGSGKYSFTMPASKVEVKATFMEDNTMLNYFVDVPASAYYYDAVLWAAEQGITGGTDATHFSPDGVCTRAQAVTFLWRAAGSPAPSATAMPFTDVAADSYYYNAVLWAVENGITVGTSSTTFSPDLKCSRAHIMTFLWRSEKSPAAGSVNPFTDVSADAYYADAVLWAVKESVTNGTSSATFSPDADCTRAQIVTFIWRTLAR